MNYQIPANVRLRKSFKSVISFTLRWLILAIFLFPIFWTILSSFKTQADLFAMPPKLFFAPTLRAYQEIMNMGRLRHYLANSVIVSAVSVSIAMVLGLGAAYGLNRFTFRGKKDLSFWIISTRMAPPVVAIIPFFCTHSQEATALGAGILAAGATGLHPDIRTAAQAMVHLDPAFFTPNPEKHAFYSQLYEDVYRHLFPALRTYMARLTEIMADYEQTHPSD